MATLINDMSAQPAFMYSFDYLSGSKSNRTISRSFKSLACQAAGKSLTSTVSTLAMQRMSLMVLQLKSDETAQLLNKPYVNEFTLRGQKQPSKCC